MDDELSARYREQWTVTAGDGPDGEDAEIVLLAPRRGIAEALAPHRARLVAAGAPVRVIGVGATVREEWPAWLAGARRRVRMTELDAYLPRRQGPIVARLLPQIERWIDAVLGGVVAPLRASTVFWSAASQRLFQAHVDAWLFALGIAEAHPRAPVACSDGAWEVYRILRALRGEADAAPRGALALGKRLALAPAAAAAGAAAGLKRLRDFARERASRAKLDALRRGERGALPRRWIVVHPQWARMSRPVSDLVPALAKAAGERLGLLVLHSLEPGERVDNGRRAGAVLPTLDLPELREACDAFDQAVSAERWRDLARVLVDAAAASARATARALVTAPLVAEAGVTVRAELDLAHLAKLLTVDVLRVREAWHATRALLARRAIGPGHLLMYPHATTPHDGVGIRLFMERGATTMELVHGIIEIRTELGLCRTATTQKVYWTQSEARIVEALGLPQQCLGGYLPRTVPPSVGARPPSEELRVLVCSNYLTSEFGWSARAQAHYMAPLLREACAAAAAQRAVVRWRPHPADDPAYVRRLLGEFPGVERSTASLEDDLRWAHVMVSSLSSVIIEGLFYGVAVFVHQVPRYDESVWGMFERERLFGLGRSLAEALAPCAALVRAGDARGLEPERALRRRMFGAGEQPLPLGPLLFPRAAERAEPRRVATVGPER